MSETTDIKSLRFVLRQTVEALRRPARELERELGIGNGALDKLLDGRLEIRLRHLLGIARILGVSPADLLQMGCPEAHRTARCTVDEWIHPHDPRKAKAEVAESPIPPPALPTPTDLAEMIRRAVRDELAAQAGSAAPASDPAAS
jgi:DNA-binding Xre family transcriptional regulator